MTQSSKPAPRESRPWDSIQYDLDNPLADTDRGELQSLHDSLVERAEALEAGPRRDLLWHVRVAHKNGSLDSLRLFAKLPTMYMSDRFVMAGVHSAHKFGYRDASTVISLRTIEAYNAIHRVIPSEGQRFNDVHSCVWELLFEDIENDQIILHLIRDRKILDSDTLRNQVAEARKHPLALIDGSL